MGKIREVDCACKTNAPRGNEQTHYLGILGWMHAIVGYLVCFMFFPYAVFLRFFPKWTKGELRECNESTKPSQASVVCTSDLEESMNDGLIIPYGTKSPFDHVLQVFRSQSPSRVTYNPNKKFERIVNHLIWLEDDGDFDTFDKHSSIVLGRFAICNPEITAAVLVEQSRCMFYRNFMAPAKSLARKALVMSSQTAFPGMFAARACLVLSALYRRKKKLGKAKLFLEKAEQNLTNTSYYEDWSRFYDEYGSYLNSFIDTIPSPSAELYKNSHESFHRQLQPASRDSRSRVREKNRFYALLKIARTLLDANTIFGQQREIPARDIRVAVECLDKIEQEYSMDSLSRGTHMQFLLVRCKQYYREKRFQEAGPLLVKLLNLAKANGYERHFTMIVKGVRAIKALDRHVEEEIMICTDPPSHPPPTECSEEKDLAFSMSEKESDNTTESIDIFGSELGDSG